MERDETTGQFTAAEPLYGIEGVEHDAGYVPRPEPEAVDDTVDINDHDAIRALADKRFGSDNEIVERKLVDENGDPVPDNETATIEQAARDLSNVHQWERDAFDKEHLDAIAAQVDKARAEKLKANPKLAEEYGIEAVKEGEKTEAGRPAKADDLDDTSDGFDGQLEKALNHPQIKQALETQIQENATVRREYSEKLQSAARMEIAAFVDQFPELVSLHPDQQAAALAVMAQQNPQRYARVQAAVERSNEIIAIQHREQQVDAIRNQQMFQDYAKAEDAKLGKLFPSIKSDVVNEIIEDFRKSGIDRDFAALMNSDKTLRSSHSQKF